MALAGLSGEHWGPQRFKNAVRWASNNFITFSAVSSPTPTSLWLPARIAVEKRTTRAVHYEWGIDNIRIDVTVGESAR